MQNIDVVFGECNTILFAFFSVMVKRWKGVFEVERWKGGKVERFPRNKSTKLYIVSSRASVLDPGSSLLETTTQPRNKAPPDHKTVSSRPANRDPVHRGGKVRLPQRPEVSSKQATPLPLPNRLRQPLIKQDMGKQPALKQISPDYILRHPGLDPGSSAQGWQSPFATETGGLFQTGNSVASAEQTSAALYLTTA